MARRLRPDLEPRVAEVLDTLKPLYIEVRQSTYWAPNAQFAIARRLATEPDEDLEEVMVELSVRLCVKLAVLKLARQVGLAFPNPHPGVSYGVYAELVKALADDRDAIFGQYPPEDWTPDKMKEAVRRYYKVAPDPPRFIKKTLTLQGLGRVTVIITDTAMEITLPKRFSTEVHRGLANTVVVCSPEGD